MLAKYAFTASATKSVFGASGAGAGAGAAAAGSGAATGASAGFAQADRPTTNISAISSDSVFNTLVFN
jgi:hypothetical protein